MFLHFRSQHVYKVHKKEANILSKSALVLPTDRLVVKEEKDNILIAQENLVGF